MKLHNRVSNPKVTKPAITCSKLTTETLNKMWNMLKSDNKDTRTIYTARYKFISNLISNKFLIFLKIQGLTLLDFQIVENLWSLAINYEKNVSYKKQNYHFSIMNFNSKVLRHYREKKCYRINQTAKPDLETI